MHIDTRSSSIWELQARAPITISFKVSLLSCRAWESVLPSIAAGRRQMPPEGFDVVSQL